MRSGKKSQDKWTFHVIEMITIERKRRIRNKTRKTQYHDITRATIKHDDNSQIPKWKSVILKYQKVMIISQKQETFWLLICS